MLLPVGEATPLQGQPCVSLGPHPARGHLSTRPVPGPIVSSAVSTPCRSAHKPPSRQKAAQTRRLGPSPGSRLPLLRSLCDKFLQCRPPLSAPPHAGSCSHLGCVALAKPRAHSQACSPVAQRPASRFSSVVRPPHPASGHHTQGSGAAWSVLLQPRCWCLVLSQSSRCLVPSVPTSSSRDLISPDLSSTWNLPLPAQHPTEAPGGHSTLIMSKSEPL